MILSKEDRTRNDYAKYSTNETRIEKLFRLVAILIIILFPLVLILSFRVVKQYKRAVILRFGRLRPDSPAGPGIIWVIPCTDDVQLIDLRTHSFNLSPQEILTKDSVTVTVDAVVYFHIESPLACIMNIQNNKYATELIAIAVVRNILGGHSLYNLLTSRESISYKCRTEMDKTTIKWGIVIERVEIKDVLLPFDLQKAMAAEAEGTRIAKAKIIEAEGEIKAAENLKEASLIMMENPNIMLLRYLQTLNHIAVNRPMTVLFPFPMKLPGLEFNNMEKSKSVKSTTSRVYPHIIDSDTDIEKKISSIGRRSSNLARIYQGFNLDQSDSNEDRDTFTEKFLVFLSYLLCILTFPFSLFIMFLVVRQFERAVILRNGKLRSPVPYGPGLIHYLPCVDVVKFTDLRIICYEIPPQEALTKDALTVAADAVIYYKINDPIWAVVNIADYKVATQYLAATTLRNALGTRKLSDILCDRPAVGFQVFGNMKNLTLNWGVKVVGFELKDISLPLQLQRAMATEAESYRLANAQIIVAKSEIECTRNLQKATMLLMDNPYCMQLRYLQALQMTAGDQTHTIVLPFSPESLKNVFKNE